MGFADVEDGQLYYEVAGEGPALVLPHAGIADCRMWDDQFDAFAEHYRVIRYDWRGYGKTKSGNSETSDRQDLRDLLTHLGLGKAYLLGVSMGGLIVVDFALEFPEMVSALIPVCAGLSGFEFQPPEDQAQRFVEMETVYKRGDMARLIEMQVATWVDGFHRTPDQVDRNVREKVRIMIDENFKLHKDEQFNAPRPLTPPAAGRLSEIKAPTLVIVGALDTANVLAVSDTLARDIPGVQKAVIDGTAHMPNMGKPAEFNRIVLDFLRRL